MLLTASGRLDSYVQFITVLILFVFVLLITWGVTKWIAGYQREKRADADIEVLETYRLAGSKYLQIVRIGRKYLVLAVCKDSVTMLTEISGDDLKLLKEESHSPGFREIWDKVQKKNPPAEEDGRDE